MTGGVQTLRNISAYNEPAWHFDAQFVDKQGHTKANVQTASGHGHFLEMNNTAYHSPYDLVDNKVNAIYIVYKIRNYDGTGIEHNYLFSCGMTDNHRGICCVPDKPHYMNISNFPTIYYNRCRKDMWNVVCVVYDTTFGISSLWVNHGKIPNFACRLPLRASTLNLFNRVVHFDESSGFNGYLKVLRCTTTSSLFLLVSFLLDSAVSELNQMLHSPILNSLSGLIGILLCNRCALHQIIKWKMD